MAYILDLVSNAFEKRQHNQQPATHNTYSIPYHTYSAYMTYRIHSTYTLRYTFSRSRIFDLLFFLPTQTQYMFDLFWNEFETRPHNPHPATYNTCSIPYNTDCTQYNTYSIYMTYTRHTHFVLYFVQISTLRLAFLMMWGMLSINLLLFFACRHWMVSLLLSNVQLQECNCKISVCTTCVLLCRVRVPPAQRA